MSTAIDAVRSELREARRRVQALERALEALEGTQAPRQLAPRVYNGELHKVRAAILEALPFEGPRRELATHLEANGERVNASAVNRAMVGLLDEGWVVREGTSKRPVFVRADPERVSVVEPGDGVRPGRKIEAGTGGGS